LLRIIYVQSEADPCLFISEIVICLVYIDDTTFYSPTTTEIHKNIRSLGMELNVEDHVAGLLGVLIKKL
jgi:hypothetical protein